MLQDLIQQLVDRKNLTQEEARGGMEQIMRGEATPAQIAAFLTALRMKGETIEEITGCAQAMRAEATTITVCGTQEMVIDTCGTGGDRSHTFNISTAAAFVVAAAGLTVAKHGNRSVSSKAGSADVLEALGVAISLTPEKVMRCIQETGIGFMFAPMFHPAMKHAGPTRKEMGIRTVFNILGPLCNPAQANVQVLGVYSPELTEVMAKVLGNLGVKQALVVHGHGPLDEISLTGPTQVSQVTGQGQVRTYEVTPEDFGLQRARLEDLKGGDAPANAELIRKIFRGESGPKRDAVLLNAAAVFVAAEKVPDFKAGVALARAILEQGKAAEKLAALVATSQRLAGEP